MHKNNNKKAVTTCCYVTIRVASHITCRVTTCQENLEMSGNLTAVREMSGISLNVRDKILAGKSCLKLFIVSCIFAFIQVLVGGLA